MSLGGGQTTEGPNAGGIFVQFNQDCTSLVAGSSSGYHLFALTPDDGVEEIYASRSGQETCLVDRLFSSSLVAIVTVSAPRKLIVCHYKKGTEICNYSYSNSILAVKLNRSRLIVCLEESLHIHNIRDMKILHTIRDTPPNPRGLCALSPCVDHCYVAYPGSSAVGEVQIFDAVHLQAKCVLSAHDSPLAALAWSMCGTRLATASERGTVIRVFAVPDRQRLYEFRRGVKRCVSISCLAFSGCGTFLAATSNTETVHVFKLGEPAGAGAEAGAAGEGEEPEDEAGWYGWLSRGLAAGAGLLPHTVAGVLAQGRAFAAARLPHVGYRARAALTERARRGAAAGGDVAGRAVRVRAARGRRRRVRAAAHAPPAGRARPRPPRARRRVGARARAGRGGGGLAPARALRPARPRALPAHGGAPRPPAARPSPRRVAPAPPPRRDTRQKNVKTDCKNRKKYPSNGECGGECK